LIFTVFSEEDKFSGRSKSRGKKLYPTETEAKSI